ncbi:FMN-binding protein [Streptomyces sp. NBS 14/10]|uniref:FMN-binding protein n=1 Tax=Streptomyces sp. NBS 14/10 TaxID=1945643 RepID=UPI000B7E7B60|nr:FMN-binding protein [Streptomyces sp. NBS 14/10]KAK1183009.1 FMN-binding protein [Streptomyces sp. NBS 14/10]NUS82352.1 FMN-binding protein [Streptomyces sp.]
MRKAALTTVSTVAGVVLLLSLKPHVNATTAVAAQPPSPSQSSSGASSSGAAPSPSTSHSASAGPTGTYTGDTINTRYGPVQLAVTLSKGKITAVKALQTPSGDGRSQQIASYAVPQLTNETLSAQNAQIDAVSGATYTSDGYVQSLQSALDKAGV